MPSTTNQPYAADALLGLLHPAWQALLAICLLGITILGLWRLASRGPTRMTRPLFVVGSIIVAITVIGTIAASCSGPAQRPVGLPAGQH